MTELKVVCITGAARRIGATIARTFHRQGFRVIIHYHRSTDAAEELVTMYQPSYRVKNGQRVG